LNQISFAFVITKYFVCISSHQQKTKEEDLQTEGYLQTFEQYANMKSLFVDHESDATIATLLSFFRNFCSLLWMLDTRDALSLAMQRKATEFHKYVSVLSFFFALTAQLVSLLIILTVSLVV
jgi:hypothetical protein